jgi:hypothetical protein
VAIGAKKPKASREPVLRGIMLLFLKFMLAVVLGMLAANRIPYKHTSPPVLAGKNASGLSFQVSSVFHTGGRSKHGALVGTACCHREAQTACCHREAQQGAVD